MALEWKTSRRTLALGARPWVMGILNVTPDSFSDGGRFLDPDKAVAHALALEAAGADLIDVGAESTRPGAAPVSPEEEMARLWPVLDGLRGRLAVPLSIDTTKAAVAAGALERGVEIVNDVSGGRFDAGLWPVVAAHGAGYVLTHSRGTPETMRQETDYADVVAEVAAALQEGLARAGAAGIAPERIALDPGFGFAKTAGQNWALLAGLGAVAALGRPVLVGLSRKSFLKSIAGEELLQVSTGVAETVAALRGAHLWRTHDVAAARAASLAVEQLRRADANA
jgi:dihydropteroate synthase